MIRAEKYIINWIDFHLRLEHLIRASNKIPDFNKEAYYLSTNITQENDWIKRHNLRPLLTVSDLMLVDRIVDEVMLKYTGCKGKDLDIFNLYKDIL